MQRTNEPPEPWRSFFMELDSHLNEDIQLHCCGGFVLTQLYNAPRTTNDVDFLGAVPNLRGDLTKLAGRDSPLRQKYRVYLDAVTVATPPEDYDQRLIPLFPGAWGHIQLFGLEAHDLALSKLERNSDRDRADVQYLANEGHLSFKTSKGKILQGASSQSRKWKSGMI